MGRSNKRGSRRDHHHHYLPEEIIENILVKLPVKSIIRFQSVSKSFLNLIKSSAFIHRHLNENKKECFFAMCLAVNDSSNLWYDNGAKVDRLFLSLCLYNEHKEETSSSYYTWPMPVLNFELCMTALTFVDQFNGIICLTDYYNNMLINPSLAEVKLLPRPAVQAGQGRLGAVGFGFDNMTIDFKVVIIRNFHKDQFILQRGEVYSLRTNSWRLLDEMPFQGCVRANRSTFFNGVVHWCVQTAGNSLELRILAFNLATELFQQMEFPQDWCTDIIHTDPMLFVLNQESLAFVSYQHFPPPFVTVWTMNKYGTEETWTKLYSFETLPHFIKPISFLNKHKFLYQADSQLILYDMLNHSSSVLRHSQIPPADHRCFTRCLEMGLCRSSLVSLNM